MFIRAIYKITVLVSTLIVLCFGKSNAQQNLSSLISEARTLALDGDSASRQRFSDQQISIWINEAQRQAQIKTRCLRSTLNFTLVEGSTYYPLPDNFLNIERVTIGSKYIQEMSPAALDGRSRGWEAASGYPSYYFLFFSSPTMVGFAPWPATSTDIDVIKMEIDIQANDLVNGTDYPFNGVVKMRDYGHALAYFAASMMNSVEGISSRSAAYMQLYSMVIEGMSKLCNSRPSYYPSATGNP